jgi:hypothetical protein
MGPPDENLILKSDPAVLSSPSFKGTSHEIDFNNVDENLQMLLWLVFEFFGGPSDFKLK